MKRKNSNTPTPPTSGVCGKRTLREYHVIWEIDVAAASCTQAAKHALEIQRDPTSIATVFDVYRTDARDEGNTEKLRAWCARIDLGETAIPETPVNRPGLPARARKDPRR